MPFETFAVALGLANLCGLPFTAGFFIKHILLISLHQYIYLYFFVLFFSLVGAIFGLFYSYRIYFNVFFDFKKGKCTIYKHINRFLLNSKFYTNTSLASNISILCLFLVSYYISYFLFFSYLNVDILFSDCFNSNLYSNYYSLNTTYSGALLNFSLLNLIVFFFISVLLLSNFRLTNKYYHIIYTTVVLLLLVF